MMAGPIGSPMASPLGSNGSAIMIPTSYQMIMPLIGVQEAMAAAQTSNSHKSMSQATVARKKLSKKSITSPTSSNCGDEFLQKQYLSSNASVKRQSKKNSI